MKSNTAYQPSAQKDSCFIAASNAAFTISPFTNPPHGVHTAEPPAEKGRRQRMLRAGSDTVAEAGGNTGIAMRRSSAWQAWQAL